MIGELVVVELFASVLLSVKAVHVLNKMNLAADPWLALSWVGLGGSAAQMATNLYTGTASPDYTIAALLVAATAVLVLDRRRRNG